MPKSKVNSRPDNRKQKGKPNVGAAAQARRRASRMKDKVLFPKKGKK